MEENYSELSWGELAFLIIGHILLIVGIVIVLPLVWLFAGLWRMVAGE